MDTSALIPSQIDESWTPLVDAFLLASSQEILISDLTAAEFVSAVSRMMRTGRFTEAQALEELAEFELWRAGTAVPIELEPVDARLAYGFLRHFALKLRAPDALHLAIVQRVGTNLVTFDRRLATAAQALNIPVTIPA